MNDQQVDNRNTPSYLSHYGMFRAPFMTNVIEDDMYYPEPTRTQRLDILLHLAQYGNELLLVTGPEGSGKTTMLHQFIKKIGEDWKVCQINANNMLTEEQLLSRISRGFSLPDESGPIDKVKASIKRRLDAMLTTHQTVLIAVDNAQILSTDALNLLLELATIRNVSKGIAVRILLFSEPQIKIQLASPELQSRQTLPIRKIDLPPFDEQQTARLIRHRVTTAGLVAKHVFNDAIISKIYKYSQGWPGLITEIAHQVLFESTPLKRREISSRTGNGASATNNGFQPLPIIVAVLVVSVLAGILIFQDQINDLFKSDHQRDARKTAAQSVQSLPASSQPATSSTGTSLAGMQTPNAPSQPQMNEAASSEEQEFPVVTQSSIPNDENAAKEKTASESQSSAEEEINNIEDGNQPTANKQSKSTLAETTQPGAPDSVEQTTEITPQPTTATPASRERHITIPLDHQEDWIMAQNPSAYTLQLVAGYHKSTVTNFISKQQLPDSDLAYYFSLNRGKGWHSLIFGNYPNIDQAKGAVTELRKHITHLKPWIRSFKNIQSDIQYARSRSR